MYVLRHPRSVLPFPSPVLPFPSPDLPQPPMPPLPSLALIMARENAEEKSRSSKITATATVNLNGVDVDASVFFEVWRIYFRRRLFQILPEAEEVFVSG